MEALKENREGSSARAEMRRDDARAHPRCWRFLRSRGDAPSRHTVRVSSETVPPLARRCAGLANDVRILGSGSSARAEMRRPSVEWI